MGPGHHVLLGVPYYGYNWPVTSKVPNATVQSNKTNYGAVKSVTYESARDFLAAHPKVVRHYDALEGSAYYTYWSNVQDLPPGLLRGRAQPLRQVRLRPR